MKAETVNTITYHDLTLIDYKECWDLQEALLKQSVDRKLRNREAEKEQQETPQHHLILCEHPHVYTLGKSGDVKNLLASEEQLKTINATYYPINRGGDITYHGPGQLVGYPILDLDYFFNDIHQYLRLLEEAIILTLDSYNIKAGRIEGLTGVWLDTDSKINARKICAMGVRCSRWVTMHGFALNVNANLDYFKHIVPCGINDKAVTSMHLELGKTIDMQEIKGKVISHFSALFNCTIEMAAGPEKLAAQTP